MRVLLETVDVGAPRLARASAGGAANLQAGDLAYMGRRSLSMDFETSLHELGGSGAVDSEQQIRCGENVEGLSEPRGKTECVVLRR